MPNTQNLATVGVTNRQDTDNIIVEQGGNIRRVQYEDIKTDILRGDAADGTISTFEESAEEFPIPAPATPQKTLWGRVKKFCSDFNDWKTGVMLFGHLVNNAESDSDTLPLAASVAKLLQEQITTNAGAIATLNSEKPNGIYVLTTTQYKNLFYEFFVEQKDKFSGNGLILFSGNKVFTDLESVFTGQSKWYFGFLISQPDSGRGFIFGENSIYHVTSTRTSSTIKKIY